MEKKKVKNKSEKSTKETKIYNGYVFMGGRTIKMGKAKAEKLVKEKKAEFI